MAQGEPMDATTLIRTLEALRVDRSKGPPARHQPIVLLWAIARAAGGQPRLTHWRDARTQLQGLLRRYGRAGAEPTPEYPFVALHRTPIWEIVGTDDPVPPAHGSAVRPWLDSRDPQGGLETAAYDILAEDKDARKKVTDLLIEQFFPGGEDGILDELGLVEVEFKDIGEPPHVLPSYHYPNRRALRKAGIHSPLQSGICGKQDGNAESIVISGGYEDDEDYGDVIIYTGHGGQDDRGNQVADQTLTRHNAALANSCRNGTPVRVVRGAGGDPTYSPTSGYRYDGLYRVDSFWEEKGRSRHRVWRFRLVATGVAAPQPVQPEPREPVGVVSPGRRSHTIQRVVRSTAIANRVKELHGATCQVCDTSIPTPTGPYAEAAHIRPLGRPHDGPDILENVLCLCPNHHVAFDFGTLRISDDFHVTELDTDRPARPLRRHSAHAIGVEYLRYHREHHGL